MGAFGAPTAKPTRLFSDSAIVRRLHRKLDLRSFIAAHTTTTVDEARKAAGLSCVSGKPNELKGTQAYPWNYGTAVKDCLVELRQHDIHIESDSDAETVTDPEDPWADAWTQEIAEHIGVPYDKIDE